MLPQQFGHGSHVFIFSVTCWDASARCLTRGMLGGPGSDIWPLDRQATGNHRGVAASKAAFWVGLGDDWKQQHIYLWLSSLFHVHLVYMSIYFHICSHIVQQFPERESSSVQTSPGFPWIKTSPWQVRNLRAFRWIQWCVRFSWWCGTTKTHHWCSLIFRA